MLRRGLYLWRHGWSGLSRNRSGCNRYEPGFFRVGGLRSGHHFLWENWRNARPLDISQNREAKRQMECFCFGQPADGHQFMNTHWSTEASQKKSLLRLQATMLPLFSDRCQKLVAVRKSRSSKVGWKIPGCFGNQANRIKMNTGDVGKPHLRVIKPLTFGPKQGGFKNFLELPRKGSFERGYIQQFQFQQSIRKI